MSAASEIDAIAVELMRLLGAGSQITPFSQRHPGFDLAQAYRVVTRLAALRRARGEIPIGRKIGFTNKAIWRGLGLSGPVWNYVFDRTVIFAGDGGPEVSLAGMPEPRIEPELVLHLASAPAAGMTEAELLACIDWIAPGFEIVQSIFPDWSFSAADAAAAYGVHGALVVGRQLDIADTRAQVASALEDFAVRLEGGEGVIREGRAENVLGGPLRALRFLVEEVARFPGSEPLGPGEIVTTGTLTEAMPARPGEAWQASFEGIALRPIRLRFC